MNNNEIIQPSKSLKTSKADLTVYTFFTVCIQTFILMILVGVLKIPLLLSAILSPFIHCLIEYKAVLKIVYKENTSNNETIGLLFQKCEEYLNITERLKFIFTLILVFVVLIPVIYVLSPFSWTSIVYTCGTGVLFCLILTYLHLPKFFGLYFLLKFQKIIKFTQLIEMVERKQNRNNKDKIRNKPITPSKLSLSNTGTDKFQSTVGDDLNHENLNRSLDIVKFTPQNSEHAEIDRLRLFIPSLPTELIRPLHRIIEVMLTTKKELSKNDNLTHELKYLMIEYADKVATDLNKYLTYSTQQHLNFQNELNQNPNEWIEEQLQRYREELVNVVESIYSDDIQIFLDHENFINQRFDDKNSDFTLPK